MGRATVESRCLRYRLSPFGGYGRRAITKETFEFTPELGRAFVAEFYRRTTSVYGTIPFWRLRYEYENEQHDQ
jgi:hypothetical protein